ncbi:MAG: hypothetical protein KA745_08015 [Gemmatimonadales bacterium]|nr:hypothetical protein [Gemmatimonadales bacterium]
MGPHTPAVDGDHHRESEAQLLDRLHACGSSSDERPVIPPNNNTPGLSGTLLMTTGGAKVRDGSFFSTPVDQFIEHALGRLPDELRARVDCLRGWAVETRDERQPSACHRGLSNDIYASLETPATRTFGRRLATLHAGGTAACSAGVTTTPLAASLITDFRPATTLSARA